jgi:N-methylhydantoinase B
MDGLGAVTFEVVRNRLVAIAEEMRIALQSVSGSPTVTEASDFFTGLFLPDGSVVSMGFQVSFQAPVSGTVIRHINAKPELKVREGDMFIGNDPYIGALHQNDVQMIGPIHAGGRIIAWAGVQAHQTDVGGMDFASWCPKAKNVYQEGIRIPCVKLIDRGELREDVLEMIVTASRLPDALGLDIRAFIATINVARDRIHDLVARYGAEVVSHAMHRMIDSSEARTRARLAELPDGEFHASDFLEHDGHANALYKVDVKLTKRGDRLILDYGGSSRQAPGFINATRAGLMGGACGSLLTTLAWDIQWNQGVLKTAEVVAPDGLICTAKFPAPVGSATVETIWVVSNATMLALNKLLATSSRYRTRAQAISDGCMATFNLGGINQYGEPFGLHLMDPIAAGSGAWASKDGVDAGGPITSPVPAIADVERNEQVSPLFYLHRRLACDTGGAGKYRGGGRADSGRHRAGRGVGNDARGGGAQHHGHRGRLARLDGAPILRPECDPQRADAAARQVGDLRAETGADGHDQSRHFLRYMARRRRLGGPARARARRGGARCGRSCGLARSREEDLWRGAERRARGRRGVPPRAPRHAPRACRQVRDRCVEALSGQVPGRHR